MPLRTWHLLNQLLGQTLPFTAAALLDLPHAYIETSYFCTTLKSEVFSIWPSFLPLFLPWPCLFCYALKILFVGSSCKRLYLLMEGGRQRPISKVMGSCSYRDICADTLTNVIHTQRPTYTSYTYKDKKICIVMVYNPSYLCTLKCLNPDKHNLLKN